MSQRIINIGTGPNTKDGDTVRQAFNLTNQNFTELFTLLLGQGETFAETTVPANTPTVVWTSAATTITTAKLVIQVEGTVSPDVNGSATWHTQICEAHVAKRANFTTAPAISVYGITYTSVSALATFTAQYNVVTNKMEVVATATNAGYPLSVKIHSTEIGTSD